MDQESELKKKNVNFKINVNLVDDCIKLPRLVVSR